MSRFDSFLENTLTVREQELVGEVKRIQGEIADTVRVKDSLSSLVASEMASLDTLVDLGAGVAMAAHVPSLRYMLVNIGLGFQVEMTPAEATAWADARLTSLLAKEDAAARALADVRASVRITMASIKELATAAAE